MKLDRIQELVAFDHLMAVEVEDVDYGGRHWTPVLSSELDEYLAAMSDTYSLSDIDHHAKCPCEATWKEWLDFVRLKNLALEG